MRVKDVEKVWGAESWIVNDAYCCKLLLLKRGMQCSLHYHPIKDETFLVVEGSVRMEVDGAVRTLGVGDSVRISPGLRHRFAGLEDSVIVETSTHHDDADVVRLSESGPYGGEW
ncbi:MAG TPA: cupin domain-containing protein [Candidatus Saccharimonadales bacterium]|nr:cupin domain-containing protein [Candidatus Saccharimonadales bacterium]